MFIAFALPQVEVRADVVH